MRGLVIALVLAAGCKDKPEQNVVRGSAAVGDAGVAIEIDWNQCSNALGEAAGAPLLARPQIVIEGCRVCGDWKPLLAWSVPTAEGGPKRELIEQTMVACHAFCTGDSKLKFMAAVDKARGTNSRMPWRQLGTLCKEQVGAVPDDRFMSAPYFALDRIARAAAAQGGDVAARLAALQLPLPALTVSGEGAVLPELDPGVSPHVGELQITALGDAIYVGKMPRATLGATGVKLDLGSPAYPGKQVKPKELGAALRALAGDDKTQTITLLAPHAMPARQLVPIIVAASAVAPVYLGANAAESPVGWPLPGAIPIALEAGGAKPLVITSEMTVANLARELAKRSSQNVPRIGVIAK